MKSKIIDAAHQTATGLHKSGTITDVMMREFDNLCLQPMHSLKAPVSHLKDPDMQKAPQALLRASEKARQLAEQTCTPFVVRKSAILPAKADKPK